MRPLGAEETQLKGSWIAKKRRVEKDAATERIEWLLRTSLHRIAIDASGWDTLYEDVNDGRFWELTYPQSEMHAGGPPMLSHLPRDEARKKYDVP
jgi:hypothetical protein